MERCGAEGRAWVKIKHHPKSVKKTAKARGSVSEGY